MHYHYYNINVRITIAGKIQFDIVKSIQIESTAEKLIDTAKVELPREFKNARMNDDGYSIAKKNLVEIIKKGDKIKIEAGYNGRLHREFEGYISSIGAEIPIVLECEDEMYKLKNGPLLNLSFASISLKGLLQKIASGYEIEALEMPLGKMLIENATAYKVLEKLKSDYGVRCFFKGKTIHAGLAVDMKPQKVHEFNFKENIRSSSDLKYQQRDGRKILLKGESLQKGGKKPVKYEYGDKGESEVTLHAPVGLNQTELKDYVEKYYHSKVYDGLEGSVDGWGEPRVKTGDSVQIIDPNYPDGYRDGQYYVEGVTTTIDGSSGFKRQNKLSFKIK